MIKSSLILLGLLLSNSIYAITIAGIEIPNTVFHTDQSTKLILNGSGIRSKFIFDIYIGSLYLENKQKTAKDVYQAFGEKRISMHFLYKELSKEKLVNGWKEGFKNNLTGEELKKFKTQINKFNDLFVAVKKGDVINLNFIPTTGTQVTLNNKIRGHVEGDDFFTALLKIWLGNKPADTNLKKAMLGNTDN